MQRRTLGRTGLDVTVLGYGAMEIRGPRVWGGRAIEPDQAEVILNAVLDAGINFIDTSPDYGQSEEFIGRFLKDRRNDYYLATKCGCVLTSAPDKDEVTHTWTTDCLCRNLEASLKRMNTDYVDLWQLHNPPPEAVQAGNLLDVMEKARKNGKTRWIGISSTLPHIATYIDWGVFDTFQIPYSALDPAHHDVITQASQAGVGVIIRGGVARGDPQMQGLGRKDRWEAWQKANLDELRSPGESRTAFLLRYTISHPDMDTTIVGTMNSEHLKDNLLAAQAGPLPPDVYEQARARFSRHF